MNRVRPLALPVLMAVTLAACGAPSPTALSTDGSAAAASPSVGTSTTPSRSSASSPSASASTAPTAPPVRPVPPALALEPIATGLGDPIGVATAPDGWLLIQERGGRLLALPPGGGTAEIAADLTDRVLGEGERGLLGVALHPDFPDDPRAFVHYTDRNGNTAVSAFTARVDPEGAPVVDPASERLLLATQQPFSNHNGGQLAFGPDGMLYLGLGDGGSGGDPLGNGQNPSTLLGKILRLDVDHVPRDDADGEDGPRYGIPDDNPFAGGGGAPEVYALGLRNPWRFSFDRVTGELWIADVGQSAYEEVNRVDLASAAGANFGWNVMEATHCFASEDCSSDGLVQPLAEYSHDLGCSVTGGHVYRGSAIEGLAGWYLFSDFCSGTLFGVASDAAGSGLAPRAILETGAAVTSFGEASDGELYLTDIGGTVYRIVGG